MLSMRICGFIVWVSTMLACVFAIEAGRKQLGWWDWPALILYIVAMVALVLLVILRLREDRRHAERDKNAY